MFQIGARFFCVVSRWRFPSSIVDAFLSNLCERLPIDSSEIHCSSHFLELSVCIEMNYSSFVSRTFIITIRHRKSCLPSLFKAEMEFCPTITSASVSVPTTSVPSQKFLTYSTTYFQSLNPISRPTTPLSRNHGLPTTFCKIYPCPSAVENQLLTDLSGATRSKSHRIRGRTQNRSHNA